MGEAQYTITMTETENGWLAGLPGGGEIRVHDPRSAAYGLRGLLPKQAEPRLTTETESVRLVDREGERVHAFLLLFNDYSRKDLSGVYERIRADPPLGCQWYGGRGRPGLYCVRRAPDRLIAIAGVVGEVRVRYGLDTELNDLGIERLWEWFGDHEISRDMVAHLLLMAVHRAELLGMDPEDVVGFVRTAAGR